MKVPTLAEALQKKLEEMIQAGELAPGEKINIDKLARKFNVSTTPLREALAKLEQDSLVLYQPRTGWSVKRFSRSDYMKYYEIQELLEKTISENMVKYVDLLDLEEMAHINETMGYYLNKKKPDLVCEENMKFHDEIYKKYPNEIMYEALQDLYQIFGAQRKTMFNDMEMARDLYEEHKIIIQAYKERSIEKIRLIMHQHFRTGIKGIERVLLKNEIPEKEGS